MHILSAPQQGESDRGCPHDWGARMPFPQSSAIFSAASRYAEKCSERQLFVYSSFENRKKKENSCTLCPSDLHRFSRLTRKSSNNKQATKTWQLPSHNTAGVKAWQRGRGRNWTLPDILSFTESLLANLYKKKKPKSHKFINQTKMLPQLNFWASVIGLQLWLIFININYTMSEYLLCTFPQPRLSLNWLLCSTQFKLKDRHLHLQKNIQMAANPESRSWNQYCPQT